MAHIDKVVGTKRTASGTRGSRRLRAEGIVPCNVYGHEQAPSLVSMQADQARLLVNSGTKIVDLEVDGHTDKVIVREVQWDTYSLHLMHIDFLRVDPNERVTEEVPLQIRGVAPGTMAGGILEQPLHHVTVECLAVALPDFIVVKVGSLELGQSIHVGELTEVPQGVTILNPKEQMVVHVVVPKAEIPAPTPAAEAAPAAAAAAATA